MPYYVRLMRQEDAVQVTELDREAFPSQWPPPNYRQELKNRLAHYIVACDEEKTVEPPEVNASSDRELTGLTSRLKWLFSRKRYQNNEPSPPNLEYVAGFAGFWVMADEAHITTIAVRETYRRQGLGELLLISAIDLATELKARIVTLEVRISNDSAQSLYTKCGFTQVGVRRGYYTDDKEDGLLMSTKDISTATYRTHLQQLKQIHSSKWGIALFQIIR